MKNKMKNELINFEDSRDYLESEGINVDELIKEGMVIIDKVKSKIAERQAKRILAVNFVIWLCENNHATKNENIDLNKLFNNWMNEVPKVTCG